MKTVQKVVALTVVGLLTAVVIYPFLHEAGHALVAVLVGVRVQEFQVLPIPFVTCDVSAVNSTEQVFVGLGGMAFPFIWAMSFRPKRFWLWYVNVTMKGIGVYSVILSAVALVFHTCGNSWAQEDIVQVLRVFPGGTWLFLTVLCAVAVWGARGLVKEKVITRCLDYCA